jgi:hypothetical protein
LERDERVWTEDMMVIMESMTRDRRWRWERGRNNEGQRDGCWE